jgi:hypothetical protein
VKKDALVPAYSLVVILVIIIIIIIMEPCEASALYEALRSKADVNLGWRSLKYQGVVVVSVGLQLNPTLLRLYLSRNFFGDSGAAAIAEALKVNSSLQQLDLSYNKIGDSGAAAIAEALKVNSTLQQLDLSYNQIGDSGAAAIAEALMRHSTLRHLYLRYNSVGHSGAMAIEESLERSFLGLTQNVNTRFPEVLLDSILLTKKHRFLCALWKDGFRSFIMNDVPPALWPHALAKVRVYPSFIFHLFLQIPVKDPPESVSK